MKTFKLTCKWLDYYDGTIIRNILIDSENKVDINLDTIMEKIVSLSPRYFRCNISSFRILDFIEVDSNIHKSIIMEMV